MATDEEILVLAREIAERDSIGLTDAMIRAEEQLAPKPTIPTDITVTIPLKPRVARWLFAEFESTDTHTTEERVAAYLQTVISRARVLAIRAGEPVPQIQQGGARTVRRADLKEASGQ